MTTVTPDFVRDIATKSGFDGEKLARDVTGRSLRDLDNSSLLKVARVARMAELVREEVKLARRKDCPPGQDRAPNGECRPKNRPATHGILLTGLRGGLSPPKKMENGEQTQNMESSTPDSSGDVSGAGKTAAWVLGVKEAMCLYSS